MKIALNTILLSILGGSLLVTGCARPNPAANASTVAPKTASATAAIPAAPLDQKMVSAQETSQTALTNIDDKVGYAIGMNIGANLKRAQFEVNLDQLVAGIKDVLGSHKLLMTEPQAQEAIMEYQKQRSHEAALKGIREGEAFLSTNKLNPGVQVHTVTLPDGKTAEMQYKIITEGTGEIPKSNDTVTVNYRGTLINGTEFDSSARHGGHPSTFVVNRVIRGWTEALQMMKVGSKWEIDVPSSLAYEDRPSTTIPAGSTLIFEIELVGIERPKPLTSDIIRVPSAEEMKAGAKIEVIKAEDAEKMSAATNVATNKPAKK